MEPRLNIVTLAAANLARARDFYEKGLGWQASSASQETIAFFQLGGVILALYPHDALAEDAMVSPSGSGFKGFTLAQNVREKHEVADVLALAEKAGGKIVKPAQDVFWGGHSGYFADPDGHLWEVAWNPFFTLNAKGEVELP